VRDDPEGELSDRLAALEEWPILRDPEPVVWADDDDAGTAAPGARGEAAPPAAERS
jgi:hypothetical protein